MATILRQPPKKTDPNAQSQEINRLRAINEVYELFLPTWDLCLSAYEGGDDFAKEENLFKHPREHKDDYTERVKRLHYLNYCAPLVDFFTDFIFAETIQRNGGKNGAFYDEFVPDVNKKGEDIETFMKQVSDDSQIFGISYVLVDAPERPAGKLSKAQERELGMRPYWVLIRPNEVLDWISDPFDNLLYFKRRQTMDRLVNGEHRKIEKYTEWSPEEIKISEIDVTDSERPILTSFDPLPNRVGVVPVVPFRHKRSKRYPWMGLSFLTNLAKNNREVMNLTSLLQEFLYRQCFNILAIQTNQQIPTKEQTEGEVGTSNQLEYPIGANAPTYVAPSAEPAKFIQEERQRLVAEMYKLAAQDLQSDLYNGGKSSGFSQAQSFSRTVPKIASRADTLEKGENKLMDLTFRYLGQRWNGKIKYKDHYEITNIADALTHLSTLFRDLQVRSETLFKEQMKRMVQEIDGKMPPDVWAKVQSEIDKIDFEKVMEIQTEALVGKGSSPAEQQKPKGTGTMAEVNAEAKVPNTKATKKLKE